MSKKRKLRWVVAREGDGEAEVYLVDGLYSPNRSVRVREIVQTKGGVRVLNTCGGSRTFAAGSVVSVHPL
jgi:hypothetical protein